jgi:hypothetical protein
MGTEGWDLSSTFCGVHAGEPQRIQPTRLGQSRTAPNCPIQAWQRRLVVLQIRRHRLVPGLNEATVSITNRIVGQVEAKSRRIN